MTSGSGGHSPVTGTGLPSLRDLHSSELGELVLCSLDGPRSIAWSQAEMKLTTAMAVLKHCLGERS